MLVVTESTLEKQRNRNYPRNSQIPSKNNSTQIKVIANRITPYCKDILKTERETIKTRKFIKDYKTKYKYIFSKNNTDNSEREKKAKLYSVEKKANLFQLKKLSKSKKKNQVSANRVNYNCIVNNSHIKNSDQEKNSYQLHLKDKKHKHLNKKSKKNLQSDIRDILLDNPNHIYGNDFPNLNTISNNNNNNNLKNKVKTNNDILYNKNVTSRKSNASYKLIDNSSFNTPCIDNNINDDDDVFKSYINDSISKKSLYSPHCKHKITTNSLIDSIVSLSNDLNTSTEQKDNEYDKNLLSYVNKILHDNNFYHGISLGVNKTELKQLESEIHKKCNDMISKFYFKTIFKNRNCTQKKKNSILKDSYNSYNSKYYDSQSSSKLVINENSNNVPKHLCHEKNRIKSPLSSNIHDNFYYSDNYFSEKPRKSEKKNNNNRTKQNNKACEVSLKNNNLITGKKNNITLAKNISKENINYKLTLDNDKLSVNYLKESHLHNNLKSFNQNFKPKKKRSIETQLTLGNTVTSSVCNNVDIKPFKYDDNNNNKDIVHDSYNSVNKLNYDGIVNTNNQINHVNKQLSTLNNFEKYDDSAFSRSNSLHYNKKCRTVSTENNDQSISKEGITIKNDHTEHRNLLNEDINLNKFDTTKKTCSQGKTVSNLSNGKEDNNNINKSDDNKTDPKCKKLSSPQVCMSNSCNISNYASDKFEDSYIINSQNSSNAYINGDNIDSEQMTPKAENILKKKFNDTNIEKNSQYNNDNTCKENYGTNEKKHINRYNTPINSSRHFSTISNNINNTPLEIYNEYDSNINNIKRNDSYITIGSDNLNDSVFNENQDSFYIPSSVYNNYGSSVVNNRYSVLSKYSNMQNKTSNGFSSPFINRSSNIVCKPRVENCNNNLLNEEDKKNNSMNLFPCQKSIDIKPINCEDKKNQEEIKTNNPKEQIESNVKISNTVKKEINFSELKNLRSSINSIASSNLRKTPTISNIENDNYSIPPKYIPEYIKSFCIFKDNHKKDEVSRITPLIDHVNSNNNDIGLITPKNKFDTSSLNKDIKMNNNDHEFSVDECLMKCLKEDPSKFRTNEDYERFCNEDKILNPSYVPHESRKLGENFLKNKKDNFSFINKNYNYEPNVNIAECGNSSFNYDGGFNDPHKNYFNNIKINVFNNDYVNNDNNCYNNNSIYNNHNINSINNLNYMKGGNDHYNNDIFIKYYEKYSIKNLDKNESEKLNYTDCYDFKDSSLTEISKDDSFCSDDLGNDDNDINCLKESLNSFDNLESTEKKYEQILKDFNGKIPLLHKVLKPLPVKNRSNNFDICLYLLQKHGGDLNNEENICILRDREIVQHSAIYDTKNNCIKSNITNVTNIKLYHPKWYNKKKIIERLKEQSCYNPFTIFGSAPSLLDFDEVFDKDVYNHFVSKNSRKNHSLLRILAKQKVISNLNDKISDKEWPQVHSYLKKRWSRETNIELNWACDPLLYEELEWYLSTNNEYLNMTDKVADIDVCYCPTLDPSSYYAWNDSRVIYTNLCYNKSKDDGEESNNDSKNMYSTNKSLEFKKNDKQLSFRKRASGCEHLMFQQNVMKQKKLSKKKKKLLKKKKKMIKEKYKTMDIDVNFGNYGNDNNREDGKIIKSAEGFSYPYKNMSNYHENKTDYINDQYMNDFKNNKENNSFYYSNNIISKNKKSIYNHKNCEDNIVPIMAVNTSLYRNNMDNKYNCHNTAFDYIKNKDNTIKFFASPKKKKKKSFKKSINSDCFDFINSSMTNSDSMHPTNNNNENSSHNIGNNNNDNGNPDFNCNDTTEFNEFNDFSTYNNNKNNFHIFEFNDSIKCNNMKDAYNKDMMLNEDNLKKKHNQKNYEQTGYIEEMCGNKNRQNDCELLDINENNFEKNNMHYFKSNTYMYDINNNNASGMKNYIAKSNDNIVYKSNYNMNQGDISQSFYKNNGKNNNYGNDNNVKMTMFRNMQMGQNEYNMNYHKGNNNDNNRNGDNCNYRKGDNQMSFIPRNFDDKNDINTYYKVYNASDNNSNHNFHKNIYGNKNIYVKSDSRYVSNDYNKLKGNELSKNEHISNNIGHFEYKSSNKNFPDQNILNQKDNINGLKEKYINMCKEEKQLITSSDHNQFNFFESNYENYNNNNDDNNERSNKIMNEYFHSKNPENYIQMEKKNKKKKQSNDTGNSNNTMENHQNNNKHINKNLRNVIPETNILKLTQENIDKKNIIENEIKNSNTLLYKKKNNNNNNAGISTSSFNSKRLSNSNISANENKKIRRYVNKMHHDSDNVSIEHSENDKQRNTSKEIAETPSSATSETSMSSAFKMATSVFKKLF
ncbi:conserved Plasmodium protein, unknown function [Plasmodium yoelii]|nr:conserved Plasmodium protein, unknown function [Plasmodium yoelii]CDU20099.1 conserved Plasmodium protein, unknown function [Plasmodium yoelii]VTZ80857.1 conserved Plasmodium protein, unknown function [Plasmodium yoelii]|eukprot:XP_724746.2 conserved Plasmodium protein, unknown function [Plasmodium yoelii]